jgi:hypothetical protein
MNVRSRRNSTCPWRLKVLWSHGWFTPPFNGASLRRLGIPLMNIFARLGLSGNSGASKVLCSFSASGHAVETAGGSRGESSDC